MTGVPSETPGEGPLTQINFAYEDGREPYRQWLNNLDNGTKERVLLAVSRCRRNPQLLDTSKTRHVGEGVREIKLRIGYRVYCAVSGENLIILGGSDKNPRRQQQEIDRARERLAEWRRRQERQRRGNRPTGRG